MVLTQAIQPSKSFVYDGHEVIAAGYEAVWFLFNGEPYDIGRFYRPDGAWTGYYVDILKPVRWEGSDPETLQPVVDLFLDLWIAPDGSYAVLDKDELEAASDAGWISNEEQRYAWAVLERLVTDTQAGHFPPARVRHFQLQD